MTPRSRSPRSPVRLAATVLGAIAIAVLGVAGCGDDGAEDGVTIGLVTNNPNGLRNVQGFVDEMTELGYIEGDTVEYVSTGEPVASDELDATFAALVDADIDLIFTAGTPTGVAAHRVTADTGIPVIFGVIADPISAGVMTDLTQPGGNMSGVKLGDDQQRRLELLLEIDPSIRRILVPFNPSDSAATSAVEQISSLADALGVDLLTQEATTDAAVTTVVDGLAGGDDAIDAVFLVPDSVVNARLADFVQAATQVGVPISGPSTAQVAEGALMTYGFIHEEAGAQAARMANRVLNGADPGELPVETTESFLAVNLAAAEAISLEVPDAVLERAEVVLTTADGGN